MYSSKTILAIAAITFAGLSFALPSKQAPTFTRVEEQVLQLERDWLAADGQGDAAWLRRLVADDFMGASADGRLLSKDDVIPRQKGAGGFAGAVPTDNNVRVFGDTAVLMGFIKTAGSAELVRVTLVYQKRAEKWQMIAAQLGHP